MPQTYKGVIIPSYADTADAVVGFSELVDSGGTLGACTSATRPAAPVVGHTIYNTDIDAHEVFNGASWERIGEAVGLTHSLAREFGPHFTFEETDVYRCGNTIHVGFRASLNTAIGGAPGFLKWNLTGVPRMVSRNTGVAALIDDSSEQGGSRYDVSGWAQPSSGGDRVEIRLSGPSSTGYWTGTSLTVPDAILGGFSYPTDQ